ncbi:MAG TPA: hypothetical protein VGM19_07830 [Armatimonadota bacterium]|jgi:mono/diheme cytochrome c family protein
MSARLLALAVLAALTALLASCGPHMDRQVSLRPFKQELPPMPAGTVPRQGLTPVPSEAEAARLRNPLAPTAENYAAGRRYYGYYCAHCHGNNGRARTPVADSYNPRPDDLTAPEFQGMAQGELYRRMLNGPQHAATAATVAPDRRWQIILHISKWGRLPQQPTP